MLGFSGPGGPFRWSGLDRLLVRNDSVAVSGAYAFGGIEDSECGWLGLGGGRGGPERTRRASFLLPCTRRANPPPRHHPPTPRLAVQTHHRPTTHPRPDFAVMSPLAAKTYYGIRQRVMLLINTTRGGRDGKNTNSSAPSSNQSEGQGAGMVWQAGFVVHNEVSGTRRKPRALVFPYRVHPGTSNSVSPPPTPHHPTTPPHPPTPRKATVQGQLTGPCRHSTSLGLPTARRWRLSLELVLPHRPCNHDLRSTWPSASEHGICETWPTRPSFSSRPPFTAHPRPSCPSVSRPRASAGRARTA